MAADHEPLAYGVTVTPQLAVGVDQGGSLVLEMTQGTVRRTTISSADLLTGAVRACREYAAVMFPPAGPGRPDLTARALRAKGWRPLPAVDTIPGRKIGWKAVRPLCDWTAGVYPGAWATACDGPAAYVREVDGRREFICAVHADASVRQHPLRVDRSRNSIGAAAAGLAVKAEAGPSRTTASAGRPFKSVSDGRANAGSVISQ